MLGMSLILFYNLGYSTGFIHVSTVNLLASSKFTDKRIAYVALSMLLDEKSEVLLLTPQSIKKDLENSNQYIVAMALNAIGETCNANMCREMAIEVGKLLLSSSNYIKKKAALACTKIVKKCPDLVELYVDKLANFFEERNHGVLLSGLSLICQMFSTDINLVPKFKSSLPTLIKYLKNLISINYSPEFDVSGITDPFLQVKILEVFAYF